MNRLQVNDVICWKSCAGPLEGTIKEIYLSKNGRDELVPWISIQCDALESVVTFCATEGYLKMMQVEIKED